MFTGIIEEVGAVENIILESQKATIIISCSKILEDVQLGDSIAVNGLCLTVTEFSENRFSADMMPVTLQKSSLGKLNQGSRVNLERALQLQSRLGGHLVSGHIDGVGIIASIIPTGNAFLFRISVSESQLKFMIPEGSLTVEGISLTIAEIDSSAVTVSIIPHTLESTILCEKRVGDQVNLESDLIGKYVYNFLNKSATGIGKGDLRGLLSSSGFV